MTREKAKAMLPIIQAWVDGKTIQIMNGRETWVDSNMTSDLAFCCNPSSYRIKQEPREFWLVKLNGTEITWIETVKGQAGSIRVREVID